MPKTIEKKAAPPMAKDAMINVLTGLGTVKDPKTANEWQRSEYDPDLIDTVYSEHWLARRCVDVPANETASKWREVDTPSMTTDQIDDFVRFEKRIKLKSKTREALRLARKYGGAAIYVAVEGQDIEKPLSVEAIAKGRKVNLIVFSRNDLGIAVDKMDTDEFSENFGGPELLTIKKTGKKVHVSRFLIFKGPGAVDRLSGDLASSFWGRSIFDRSLITAIERCESAADSLERSLEQATVDVLKIPDLFLKLADPESTRLLRARISEGATTRSVYRMALVDMGEDFVRAEATGSLSAGAQILAQLLQIPSGATGIPVTKLLGISPGGLNATGESDLENYYDMLGDLRDDAIISALDVFDAVACRVLFGREFSDWSSKWPSFWSSDKVQDSTIETNRINGIVALVQNQILPEAVALRQLFEDGIYSALDEETVKDFESFIDEQKDEPPPEPELPEIPPVEQPIGPAPDDLENLGPVQ
jgi:phage-related protein (TIGR01555 family)